MFDIRRAAIFLFGTPLFKVQNDCTCQKYGGHGPLCPPWLHLWFQPGNPGCAPNQLHIFWT